MSRYILRVHEYEDMKIGGYKDRGVDLCDLHQHSHGGRTVVTQSYRLITGGTTMKG